MLKFIVNIVVSIITHNKVSELRKRGIDVSVHN